MKSPALRLHKRNRPTSRRLLTGLLLLLALAAAWSAWQMIQIESTWRKGKAELARVSAPSADAAIVLGSRAWGEEPSPSLAERLDVAAALYQQGRARHIILTGGVDTGNTISEAEVEARYLAREYGIPAEAMALETTSTSTVGNLRNARAILAERGWQSVLLVTHGYHLHRALILAREEGVSAVGVAAESTVLFMPYHVAREVVALTWYAIPVIRVFSK